MTELLGLPYSPWSEKARWALEARGIPYTPKLYAPLLGEPALRMKLGKWSGNVSVPVLTTDEGKAIADSANIARWANAHGHGPSLFPPADEARIAHYIEESERGLAAGRVLGLMRVLADKEAQVELTPKPLRSMPLASAITALGVARTLRKYGQSPKDHDAAQATLIDCLEGLRRDLAASPNPGAPKTLLREFTFADIAMAQVLVFVSPPAFGVRIGHANRRSFSDEQMKERFPDLLAWRDALYETYRPRGS
jgi:glutathione S-transferase